MVDKLQWLHLICYIEVLEDLPNIWVCSSRFAGICLQASHSALKHRLQRMPRRWTLEKHMRHQGQLDVQSSDSAVQKGDTGEKD